MIKLVRPRECVREQTGEFPPGLLAYSEIILTFSECVVDLRA